MRAQQVGRDPSRAIVADHAAEQQMARIRRTHRARPLFAVERQRVGAELLAPERPLETLPKLMGLDPQPLGGEHVALPLRQRDIALGESPIGMKDRVEGILPALIAQSLLGGALIL